MTTQTLFAQPVGHPTIPLPQSKEIEDIRIKSQINLLKTKLTNQIQQHHNHVNTLIDREFEDLKNYFKNFKLLMIKNNEEFYGKKLDEINRMFESCSEDLFGLHVGGQTSSSGTGPSIMSPPGNIGEAPKYSKYTNSNANMTNMTNGNQNLNFANMTNTCLTTDKPIKSSIFDQSETEDKEKYKDRGRNDNNSYSHYTKLANATNNDRNDNFRDKVLSPLAVYDNLSPISFGSVLKNGSNGIDNGNNRSNQTEQQNMWSKGNDSSNLMSTIFYDTWEKDSNKWSPDSFPNTANHPIDSSIISVNPGKTNQKPVYAAMAAAGKSFEPTNGVGPPSVGLPSLKAKIEEKEQHFNWLLGIFYIFSQKIPINANKNKNQQHELYFIDDSFIKTYSTDISVNREKPVRANLPFKIIETKCYSRVDTTNGGTTGTQYQVNFYTKDGRTMSLGRTKVWLNKQENDKITFPEVFSLKALKDLIVLHFNCYNKFEDYDIKQEFTSKLQYICNEVAKYDLKLYREGKGLELLSHEMPNGVEIKRAIYKLMVNLCGAARKSLENKQNDKEKATVNIKETATGITNASRQITQNIDNLANPPPEIDSKFEIYPPKILVYGLTTDLVDKDIVLSRYS